MKRLIVLAALVAAAVFVAVPAANPASSKDYKGAACNNIVGGGPTETYFVSTTGIPTVSFDVQYEAALCSNTVYSFYVTDTSGAPLASSSSGDSSACTPQAPAAAACLNFVVGVPNGPATVCVYATTARKNGSVLDYAPEFPGDLVDPSCPQAPALPELSLTMGSGSGAGGFR